jgi:hypothetical protein
VVFQVFEIQISPAFALQMHEGQVFTTLEKIFDYPSRYLSINIFYMSNIRDISRRATSSTSFSGRILKSAHLSRSPHSLIDLCLGSALCSACFNSTPYNHTSYLYVPSRSRARGSLLLPRKQSSVCFMKQVCRMAGASNTRLI